MHLLKRTITNEFSYFVDSGHLVINPEEIVFTPSGKIQCFTLASEDDALYETSREVRLSVFLNSGTIRSL